MNICIYCASSGQVPENYVADARLLGTLAARMGHTLVNGAGRTGLMGAASDAALAEGGEVVGVIPRFMVEQGWHHQGLTRLEVVPDMHRRKERMARLADACIALPGGVGTLEELLEIITWKQLGLYLNPIVVLNTDGYFDALLAQLRRAVDERFMRDVHALIWQVAATPAEALRLALTTPAWDRSIRKFAAL